MKAALVIMAAGLGSRYGGNKQVDGVGPGGEILMEYSIHDAIRAGFTKVVFIIKDDMVDLMRTLCGDRIAGLTARDGEPVEVCYAVQDYSSLPAFYTVPAGRTKPFGTTHAVLCARPYVQEPFCVINADDYYGVDAYRAIYQELGRLPQQGKATMVGYLLRNTVSAHGTVSRGVCHVEDGHLTGIHEALKIQLFPDGSIADVADGQRRELAADMPVSMNFWGFMPSIFDQMEEYLDDFLRTLPPEEIKAECLLPNMVGDLLKKGRLSVSVLHSADRWFGMTYHQDRQAVARELARLHENGTYPPTLRSRKGEYFHVYHRKTGARAADRKKTERSAVAADPGAVCCADPGRGADRGAGEKAPGAARRNACHADFPGKASGAGAYSGAGSGASDPGKPLEPGAGGLVCGPDDPAQRAGDRQALL